jgi:hypothetical protein
VNQESQNRLNNLVHWAYGTGWGTVRSLLESSGIGGLPASLIHFALLWGAEQVMLPKVGVMRPITEQEPKEIAIDVWHHFVYTQATATAYKQLFDGIPRLRD